jgi:hypothetical protein
MAEPVERLTASQRFFAAIGKLPPPPLTEAEQREFDAAQDRADAEVERLYGRDAGRSAA